MPKITQNQLCHSMANVKTAMDQVQLRRYLQNTAWRFEYTLREIPKCQNDDLLIDIGCYAPFLGPLREFWGYRRFGAVALYDWGPFDTKVLPSWAKAAGIELAIWIGNIEREDLPWPSGEASVVLMLEILEHFTMDPMRALWQANRLLRPGGTLVLSTPNAASLSGVFRAARGYHPHQDLHYNGIDGNRHNRLYDPHELCHLVEAAGFGSALASV